MKIIELTDDNVIDYEDFFDDTVIADIGREYHEGLVIENSAGDGIRASIFWELKNAEVDDVDTTSEILDLVASDSDGCEEILRAFNEKGIESGAKRSYFEFASLDSIQKASLENDGFKIKKTESRDIFVSVGDLAKLPFMKIKPPGYIKSLSEVTERQFKTGVMTSVLHGRYGLLDDLPFLPMSWFDMTLSSCVITDGVINGLLLVRRVREGLYRVELFFAMKPDANINLLNLMRYSIRAAVSKRSKDDVVILRRHSNPAVALVKRLFPDRNGDEVMWGEKIYG